MLSKEEILGRPEFLPRDNVPDYLRTMYDPKKVLAAMDEYSKQEAIGFARWILDNAYSKDSYWYLHEYMSGDTHTTDELYIKYINSKPNATK